MSDSTHSTKGLQPPPSGCLYVRCSNCFTVLMVGPGMYEFICERCQLQQSLPPEMALQLHPLSGERQRIVGIDPTKLQVICGSCKAILNVPHGLTWFNCPMCVVDLTMDPSQFPPPPNPPIHPGLGGCPDGIPMRPEVLSTEAEVEENNEVAVVIEHEEDEGCPDWRHHCRVCE